MFVLLFTVGTYGKQSASRYCMSVKNVIVSGDLFKDSRYYFNLHAANFYTRYSQFCISQFKTFFFFLMPAVLMRYLMTQKRKSQSWILMRQYYMIPPSLLKTS